MSQMEQLPKIADFYKGHTLFITGFSGFIGQLLVEKFLRTCPGIECIYVLIRGRKTLDYKARTEAILNSRAYALLREQNKEMLKKVIPLDGDLNQPGLGLTPEQRSEICQKVTMVFHSAASVHFDDPLCEALDVNLKGTIHALELALNMSKLIEFIYVSTAYTNSNRFDVEEKIYPPVADWRKTLEIRDKVDQASFEILSKKFMKDMVNSYVFAKSLAEHAVLEYSEKLPSVVILRPSIVTATKDEPVKGWVENLNGPNAATVGIGAGLLRTIMLKEDIMPDFMPADFAVSGLIVSACANIVDREKLKIYNWCSNTLSLTFREYTGLGMIAIRERPFNMMLWSPKIFITTYYFLFYLHIVAFQLVPAALIDVLIRLAGKPPVLWRLQRKIFLAMSSLSYFLLNDFNFRNQNVLDLEKRIRPDDYESFGYIKRPRGQKLQDYFNDCLHYQGVWLFRMTEKDVPKAQRLRNIMDAIDFVVKTCFYAYVSWKVYTLNMIPAFLNSTYNFIVNF